MNKLFSAPETETTIRLDLTTVPALALMSVDELRATLEASRPVRTTARDLQLVNLRLDLASLLERFARYPDRANARRIRAIRAEIEAL